MSDYIPTGGASTRWLTEEVFKLIDLVHSDEAIYNPRHKYYFCRPYVENFWREVDQKLDKNPGASLAKWTNLRISFRREFTNYLEEKVPPCWSYFDRMFFLHPYLRKKQQTTKQDDNSLQETLAQISDLSRRLERHAADKANKPTTSTDIQNNTSNNFQQPISDNYFDYYDEPEQNNSELDDIMEDDTRHDVARYPQVILETPNTMQQKIKSENEDDDDDYELRNEMRSEILLDSDAGDEISSRDISPPPRLGKRSHHAQQQQIRLEHLNRLQTRSYHEDLRAKRPRSQERSLGSLNTTTTTLSNNQRSFATANASNNVSFVRPTVSKSNELSSNTNANTLLEPLSISSSTSLSMSTTMPGTQTSRYYGQRCDAAGNSSTLNAINSNLSTNNNNNNNALSTPRQPNSPLIATAPQTASTPHVELCDCKTDPDAMFLMSLLPDIQKLNGRDRGKIKIAFQNILQDYLYPD